MISASLGLVNWLFVCRQVLLGGQICMQGNKESKYGNIWFKGKLFNFENVLLLG